MQLVAKFSVILLTIFHGLTALAQDVDLFNFTTDSGECSAAQKADLQKASLIKTLTPFQTYTLSEVPIERRRGASPPTGKSIQPLKTLLCLAKDGNKILVTTKDPLDKSCGWVRAKNLKIVSSKNSLLGSNMAPCGDIKPLSVGEFCQSLTKLENLSPETKKLTQYCTIEGVSDSSIDAKFVTDNTTSRLYSETENELLVKREIPLYLTNDV